MCGIFGYYNYQVARDRRTILEFLITGLRRLEYRGYDSAGICIDAAHFAPCNGNATALESTLPNGKPNGLANGLPNGKTLGKGPVGTPVPLVIKSVGKVDALVDLTYSSLTKDGVDLEEVLTSHTGIAHTRWATHGVPCALNSHPHVSDPNNEFVVVHNGIITNYNVLKDFLTKRGAKFVTDTDTEVIVKLIKYLYDNSPEHIPFSELVIEVMSQLEGAFSLLFKSTRYPGELVACKRGSPLIFGFKEQDAEKSNGKMIGHGIHQTKGDALEAFLASDASAVVEHIKEVVPLEDNDVVHLSRGSFKIFNSKHEDPTATVPRVLLTLEMEVNQIMKGGYDHFMQKEIHEQPESILQTMRGRVNFSYTPSKVVDPYKERRITLGGLTEHVSTIRHGRRLMFIACGTSYNACLACRQTAEELVDIPVCLELASDLMDRRSPIYRDDMCVFVSQSGETADTLAALQYARKKGAMCIGVTNTVGSAIARGTDCGVFINAGCEIGVASTKAYTSQIVALTMMAVAVSEDSISKRAKRDEIVDAMGRLPDTLREVLKLDGQMRELAESLKQDNSLLVFGRGYNYATALEAALKVKEVALMHSEGILAGEMKHGPLALVDELLPIIVLATRDAMFSKMYSVLQQLLARAARLIIVCNEGDKDIAALCKKHPSCRLIEVPQLVDCLQPIVNIVPLQLLSYHLTILRGYNVDQPRNLAKSVTVTED